MDTRSVRFCPICGAFVYYKSLSYNKDDAINQPASTECGEIICENHYSEIHYVNGSCRERIAIDKYVVVNDSNLTIYEILPGSKMSFTDYAKLVTVASLDKIPFSTKEEIENFLLLV